MSEKEDQGEQEGEQELEVEKVLGDIEELLRLNAYERKGDKFLYGCLLPIIGEPSAEYTSSIKNLTSMKNVTSEMVVEKPRLTTVPAISSPLIGFRSSEDLGLPENFSASDTQTGKQVCLVLMTKRSNRPEQEGGTDKTYVVVEGKLQNMEVETLWGEKERGDVFRSYMLDSDGKTIVTERWKEIYQGEGAEGVIKRCRIVRDPQFPVDFWGRVYSTLQRAV